MTAVSGVQIKDWLPLPASEAPVFYPAEAALASWHLRVLQSENCFPQASQHLECGQTLPTGIPKEVPPTLLGTRHKCTRGIVQCPQILGL